MNIKRRIEKVFSYRPDFWVLALAGLLLLHWFANLFWVSKNNTPLPWDPSNHLYISMSILEGLKDFDILAILNSSNYYPILVHFLSSIFFLIFGVSAKLSQVFSTLFFLITIIVVFIYAKLITKSKFVAFFTAFFVSLSPIFFNQSRNLLLDIPSVCFLFLSLIFLEKSRNFQSLKNSILFFIFAGCLVMTKWTGTLFLIIPGAFVLIDLIKTSLTKKILENLILGALIFSLVTLPWYLAHFRELLVLGNIYSVDHSNPDAVNIFTFNDYLDYIKIFIRDQVTPIPAFAFFLSLIAFYFLKVKSKLFLVLMFFITLLFFSFLGNKDSRFTMHLVIFSSLIAALVFEKLLQVKKNLGIILIALYSIFLLSYFSVLTLRPWQLEGLKIPFNTYFLGEFNLINITNETAKKYDESLWSFDKLLPELKKMENPKRATNLLVISEWEHFNPSNIRTYSNLYNVSNLTTSTADIVYLKTNFRTGGFPNQVSLEKFISKFDYVLLAEGNLGSPILINGKGLSQIQEFIDWQKYPECNNYITKVSRSNTKCIVKKGQILTTESDLEIDGVPKKQEKEEISGFSKVYCPWGCSFREISNTKTSDLSFELMKTYTLPNGKKINLFKIKRIN